MREKILEEIRRLAEANDGQPPGSNTFENATGIQRHDWRGKYWAKWSDAVTEAGFKPLEINKKLERAFIFPILIAAIRHYGREPSNPELDMYRRINSNLPSRQTLLNHFLSKAEMFSTLREWMIVTGGFSDIVALLPESPKHQSENTTTTKGGYVYLIKSGAFFKIGRGDELEKRVKQIRTALPDASTLEHSIRTDDPPGIEAYWHRRFAEKRANGEWFKLTSADVASFRKRKYQ